MLTKSNPHRLLHMMLRVSDLQVSVTFYTESLGMTLLRQEDYPDGRFSLAFLGYVPESEGAVLELTWNWDDPLGELGQRYGHIAVAVRDLSMVYDKLVKAGATGLRPPGPMKFKSTDGATTDQIAFVSDPDGYSIELIGRD